MEHLDEISDEELKPLSTTWTKKPTERLLAAIAYKNGVTKEELAEWYDVHRKTICNWLMRLNADESLEHSVTNTHGSGRKRKLSETQQQEFKETVHDSSEAVGVDASA